MIATLQKGYVLVALAFVLVAGMIGGVVKADMAAPLHHSSATHTTSRSVGVRPHIECPPPPFNCMG